MKPVLWFRVSAVILFLFAAGHTFGFLTFRPTSAEGQAVWSAMNNVHFSEGGATFSYGNFYLGLGLFITFIDLFFAWMAWRLASMARRGVSDTSAIAWGMCALQVIGLVLSLRYLGIPPVVFSAIAAGCLAMGALSASRQARLTGSVGTT
ncbi:MAG TPA: hypothetical protein VGN16_06800 [Acidobacteriaceae bacterium]|jgi:hypothetical protein